MNTVLELSIKAVIQHLNGDMKAFYNYKDKAIAHYEKQKFDESCRYPLRHMIPEETREKLNKIVS